MKADVGHRVPVVQARPSFRVHHLKSGREPSGPAGRPDQAQVVTSVSVKPREARIGGIATQGRLDTYPAADDAVDGHGKWLLGTASGHKQPRKQRGQGPVRTVMVVSALLVDDSGVEGGLHGRDRMVVGVAVVHVQIPAITIPRADKPPVTSLNTPPPESPPVFIEPPGPLGPTARDRWFVRPPASMKVFIRSYW